LEAIAFRLAQYIFPRKLPWTQQINKNFVNHLSQLKFCFRATKTHASARNFDFQSENRRSISIQRRPSTDEKEIVVEDNLIERNGNSSIDAHEGETIAKLKQQN
jgi:hypothetical protein